MAKSSSVIPLFCEGSKGQERFFRALIESSPDCICNLTLDGYFIYMSPAGRNAHGLREDDIRGLHCSELALPEYRELLKSAVKKAGEGEEVRFQYQSNTPSGLRWFESILIPIKNDAGRIESLLRISRDITARKIVEEELLKKHEELKSLFKIVEVGKREWERTMDCVGEMVVLIDDKGRIGRCNRAFKQFTGMTYQEIIGKEWEGLLKEYGWRQPHSLVQG